MKITNSQADKLGEEIRKYGPDEDRFERLSDYARTFIRPYEEVRKILVDGMGLTVTGRPLKSMTSIMEKLNREHARLSQIQDIAGLRVVVGSLQHQDFLVEELHKYLVRPKVVDRRQKAIHGYRAVHVIDRRGGQNIEIQLRTRFQNGWADTSEKIAEEFGQGIKYGIGSPSVLSTLRDYSDALWTLDKIRADQMNLKHKRPLQYHKVSTTVGRSRVRNDLERADRLCVVSITEILNRKLEK